MNTTLLDTDSPLVATESCSCGAQRNTRHGETDSVRPSWYYHRAMVDAETFPPPFKTLISEETLQARIAELGAEITKDYQEHGDDLILIGVLKGSILFMADLCRHIRLPLSMDFMGIASYGDGSKTSGVVQITSDLSKPIAGKHVIVVEDIIDTGLTAHYLFENLATRQPGSVKLCSLLHKPERSEVEVKIDYLGFTVPNKFVVGYGLDIAQKYRNLGFIGYVEE